VSLRRALTFFDVTNMTVGAIIGADIYIAAAITAGLLGPASLLAWAVAGLLATILALTLADCARIVPEVGGPYAYATKAFGRFPGFLAGWSMWIAELTAMPVFAIAFTSYLGYFVEPGAVATHAIRVVFVVVLTAVNVRSVRFAGSVNDWLTALKLAPLVLLVIGGVVYMLLHLNSVSHHLSPFAPFGWGDFPKALVLVFWAYAGFELSTVPAGEVEDPGRTIPRALMVGMLIVAAFYLSTNFILYAVVQHTELAASNRPLVLAASVVFGGTGAVVVSLGAMVSVSGSDESDMLGSSRLGYAMAADGLLPHALADVHPRFQTPHVALISQACLAIALTFVDRIADLISFAVFNLGFSFLLSALALLRLQRGSRQRYSAWQGILPLIAIAISLGLIGATSLQDKLIGSVVLASGAAVHLVFAPGFALPRKLEQITHVDRVRERLARHRLRFLGAPLSWIAGKRTPP
jgi:basic amino acid/polyamine antiporter, APA family